MTGSPWAPGKIKGLISQGLCSLLVRQGRGSISAMHLHLKDELLGGKVNTACPGHRVVMGAGASKTFLNTRNNCFFLIQMARCVKGIAEQEVVFFFLKCITSEN